MPEKLNHSFNYFECYAIANSPRDAFKLAKKDILNDYGSNPSVPTILKKESYTMATYKTITDPQQLKLIISNSLDSTYIHTTSPAGCIRIKDNPRTYIFYGYVSI